MTERHTDATVCFVSPNVVRGGDGSVHHPFASVRAALDHFRPQATKDRSSQERSSQEDAPTQSGGRTTSRGFEIACVDAPGALGKRSRKPRFRFYIDEHQQPDTPDGSESAPWSNLSAAVDGLSELHERGCLQLRPGDRLTVINHEVFTATSLDRIKARKERVAKFVFFVAAMLLVVPVVAILAYLTIEAWPALSLEFVFENPSDMGKSGGIWAPLVGTFFLVFVSLMISAPIGVLAGVYLNEYAPDNWFNRIVSLAVVNLAGVPSIVHGLFGFGAFVLFAGIGKSVLAASCTLAVMTLPVVITSTREALAAVPMSFREACWNMGASRWQTIRTIVLPNSISGILTGVILQVSRVAGETAPILFAGAAAVVSLPESGFGAWVPFGLNESFMALSYHLYLIRTQIQGVPESVQFATAVVLIGLVLAVNSASIGVRMYLRSRKKW